MLRHTTPVLVSMKGYGSQNMRPLNPGLRSDLAPKSMHQQVATPHNTAPFDELQISHPDLIGGFWIRAPQIMKGFYGRISKNKASMTRASRWITLKLSAYRWLKKQELNQKRISNVSAGMEEHGLSFTHYRRTQALHGTALNLRMMEELAQNEPLAFRCMAEVARSENFLMYDKSPEYRSMQIDRARKAQQWYTRHALNHPLPMRRRLPDPNWREIPYQSGRAHDKNFHGQHPIFLVDWKI
ncbi:50S ribosomal protein L20 [Diplonema papillatum]|nr:50S ribosomal protein L20 [Diplonema papillatum]